MALKGRMVWAILAATWSWFIYIFVVDYIFNYVGNPDLTFGDSTTVGIGDITTLRYYITFFGWAIIGLSFATQMAEKKTAWRQIWNALRLIAGIVFWAMFIAAGFDNFDVGILLPQADLNISVNISLLFYSMMGAKIFQMILVVFDFFISFIKEDEKVSNVTKESTNEGGFEATY